LPLFAGQFPGSIEQSLPSKYLIRFPPE
jgi:hypothetical protein